MKTNTIIYILALTTITLITYAITRDIKKHFQTTKNLESELSLTFQDTVRREAVKCYSDSGEGVRLGRNEVGMSMNGKLIGGYMVSLNPIGSNKEVGLHCNSENSNITYFQQDTVSLIDKSKPDIYKLEERISILESKVDDLEFQERINRNK
jgi:hypothetical protein